MVLFWWYDRGKVSSRKNTDYMTSFDAADNLPKCSQMIHGVLFATLAPEVGSCQFLFNFMLL